MEIMGQVMENQNRPLLRKLPSVDALVSDEHFQAASKGAARKLVVDAVRNALDGMRQAILNGEFDEADESTIRQSVVERAAESIAAVSGPHYRRVVNAAGIILHTGLGRAVMPAEAIDRIDAQMRGYSLLQAATETGKRSKRDGRIEWLLRQLTGAEAATVVNNNAAATALILNTIAAGKEVIVSRGQLVEIGGAFRLPDVMAFSGAKLVEVGTTNKTHARDYANAITEDTAAILRVHPSNYKIQGFSSQVPLEEMVDVAHSNNLVMIDDVGSGALMDFSQYGFEPEPTLPESVEKGADIVCSSADKLIGSSQGGIILGKSEYIAAIRKNQFARIVRVGKLTLAALEATLELFLDQTTALSKIPTISMVLRSQSELRERAEAIVKELADGIDKNAAEIETADGFSQMGSGSLPAQNMPTILVSVRPAAMSAEAFATALRKRKTPVFTRIQNDRVLMDPRTLWADDDKILIEAVIDVLSS